MRNYTLKSILILAFLLALTMPSWAQRGPGPGMQGAGRWSVCPVQGNFLTTKALNASEADALAYLREEEKLARDVYARLFSKWEMRIFGNISQSEQRHCDALKMLLDRYQLPDPAADSPAGAFQNEGLQSLYADLTARGETSLREALRVGAIIEDMDIHHLEKAIAATDNEDLKWVYGNLLRASENHLRAFVRQLDAAGEHYSPQYISPESLIRIMANARQFGAGKGGRKNGWRGMARGRNGICPRADL